MKKTYSVLLLSLMVIMQVKAQTFSPGKTVSLNVDNNDTYTPKIYIINPGSTALDLSWEVVSNTFLTGWDVALCDWMQCYTTLPSSKVEPADIAPSDTVFMYPMVAVNSIAGSGSLKIRVFPTGTSAAGDTLTFTINASNSVGINDIGITTPMVLFYPNPFDKELTIESEQRIENIFIYNVLGECVMNNNALSTNAKIDLSSLPNGTYFIKYEIDDAVLTKKIIKSQNFGM